MKIRDRIKEFRRVKASEILPNPKNWRTHPKAQKEALQGLLAEIGFAGAVLARETPHGLMLIDGHLRTETAVDAEIPVLILDVDEKEANKILATFDPISAMADSDAAALDALLRDVETSNEAVANMLDELAKDAGCEWAKDQKEIVEDEVPEPPVDPITKPGDIWILGDHRLLCGDSTNSKDVSKLMNGEKADLCFTSPPYALGKSVALSGNKSMSKKQQAYDQHKDNPDEWASLMNGWFESSVQAISNLWLVNVQPLAGNKRDLMRWINDRVDRLIDIVTWDKGHAAPPMAPGVLASRYEWIIGLGQTESSRSFPLSSWRGTLQSVYQATAQRKNEYSDIHAATMPIHLPVWIMEKLCDQSKSVYEPFCGTGTTLIAAEQLGRKCYGMEISPAYCDVIVKRWETLTGKKAVRSK